uniref:Uncharacterized protein n=1 Tax=Arundo donax TaxID=35708 RepID=A0A0A9FZA7_ARUDO
MDLGAPFGLPLLSVRLQMSELNRIVVEDYTSYSVTYNGSSLI